MRIGLRTLALLLAASVLVGGSCGMGSCVQFDAQSIHARHNAARDRLDALFVYRGLTSDQPAVGSAIEQLEAIRDGRKTFGLIYSLPFTLDERDLVDGKGIADPVVRALWLTIARNIEIRSGTLWRDDRARLCGSQLIRLTHVREVLAAGNELIAAESRLELQRLERRPAGGSRAQRPGHGQQDALDLWLDAGILARLVQAADTGRPFLSLRGSALVVSLPLAEAGVASFKHALLADLRRAISDPEQDSGGWWILELLARNRIAMEPVADGVEFVLGDPATQELLIESPPLGLTGTDLAGALTARGWTIGGVEGEAQSRAAFESFCREP